MHTFCRKYFSIGDVGINNYNALINELNPSGDQAVTSAHIADLAKLLFIKHQYDVIFYIDFDPVNEAEPTIDPLAKPIEYWHWQHHIEYLFKSTYKKFEVLLAAYEAQATHLSDKIKSRTTSKFNDAPQTDQSGYVSDAYASTYTVNESEVDFVAIERLKQLEDLYAHILRDWCNEFEGVFIQL